MARISIIALCCTILSCSQDELILERSDIFGYRIVNSDTLKANGSDVATVEVVIPPGSDNAQQKALLTTELGVFVGTGGEKQMNLEEFVLETVDFGDQEYHINMEDEAGEGTVFEVLIGRGTIRTGTVAGSSRLSITVAEDYVHEETLEFQVNEPEQLMISAARNTYSVAENLTVILNCTALGVDGEKASDDREISWEFRNADNGQDIPVFFNEAVTLTASGASAFSASSNSFNFTGTAEVRVVSAVSGAESAPVFIEFVP